MSEDQPPGSPEPKLKAERTKSLAAHTTSVPLSSENTLPNTSQLSRGTSLRVREKTTKDNPEDGGGNRGSWSFGSVGKVVGLFGSGVVQGTKAVGSGVVQGTKAVGTGVVQGTKAVGTGVVTTSKVVGTGVVQGTIAVGTGVVEGGKAAGRVTVAAGKGVVTAGEIVGNAAVTGATAIGSTTMDVGSAVATSTTSAINDSTNWVKAQSESLSHEFASTHTLLPDQTLQDVANEHGCSIHNIIKINQLLSRRQLRTGKELLIPIAALVSSTHQLENLNVKGSLILSQIGPGSVGNEMLKGGSLKAGLRSLSIDGSAHTEPHKDGILNFSLKDFIFQPIPQSGGQRPQSSGGRRQSRDGRSPSRQQIQMMSSSMSSNNSSFSIDPIVTISMGQISRIWAEFSANSSNKDRVPELLPAGSARAMKTKNDFRVEDKERKNASDGAMLNEENGCGNSPPLKPISSLDGGTGSPPTECVVVELDMEKKLEELQNEENDITQGYDYVYITIGTSSPSPRGSRNFSECTHDSTVFHEEDEDEISTGRPRSPSCKSDVSTMEAPSSARYLFEISKSECVDLLAYLDLWYREILDVDVTLQQYLEAQAAGDDKLYDQDGPSVLDPSHFLSEQQEMDIYLKLPLDVQNRHWSLAYSTETNGFSLHNLYRTVAEHPEPFLIAILDNSGHVFGAFLTCTPQLCENFIGTGRSWLFAYSDPIEGEDSKINIFHWSGQNEYFFRGSTDSIVIGAAEGKFGILVDGDLHRGRIQECSTFENWPLKEEDFTVKCLECWKFI